MRGRPKTQLVLTQAELEQLTALTLRRKTAQALALRARIVLACAQGSENKVVASRQRVTPQTVSKWRARFVQDRLDGLLDAPRTGAPRTIDDARVDAVIAKTLESVPQAATHWSTRTMAREAGLSQTAVSRIWRAFGLQPHRQETFKLSSDPLFVEKVRDIVGLYMDPPLKAMVLCVDEKSQIQALDRTQPLLPLAPGIAEGSGDPPGNGQLRHTQDARHQELAYSAPSFSRALHADLCVLAEPGRALVRHSDAEVHSPQHPPLNPSTRAGNQALHQGQQRRPQTIRLVKDCR